MTNNLKKGFILSLSILLFACANNNNIKNTTFNKDKLNEKLIEKTTDNSKKSNFQGPKSFLRKLKNKKYSNNNQKEGYGEKEEIKEKPKYENYFKVKNDEIIEYIVSSKYIEHKKYKLDESGTPLNQISINKEKGYAVIIGGGGNILYLWDLNTKEVIKKLSVSDLVPEEFDTKDEEHKKKLNNEKSIKITHCCINKTGNKFIVGLSNGSLIIYSMNQKQEGTSGNFEFKKNIIKKAHKNGVSKIIFDLVSPNIFHTISNKDYKKWQINDSNNKCEKLNSFSTLINNTSDEKNKISDKELVLVDFDISSDGKGIFAFKDFNEIIIVNLESMNIIGRKNIDNPIGGPVEIREKRDSILTIKFARDNNSFFVGTSGCYLYKIKTNCKDNYYFFKEKRNKPINGINFLNNFDDYYLTYN